MQQTKGRPRSVIENISAAVRRVEDLGLSFGLDDSIKRFLSSSAGMSRSWVRSVEIPFSAMPSDAA